MHLLHALFLDPYLPPWLPEITVSNLHVGDAVVSIRFYRDHDSKSNYEVLEKRGHLHVVRQPSPWSLTAGPVERIIDVLESALPTRKRESMAPNFCAARQSDGLLCQVMP